MQGFWINKGFQGFGGCFRAYAKLQVKQALATRRLSTGSKPEVGGFGGSFPDGLDFEILLPYLCKAFTKDVSARILLSVQLYIT